MSYGNVQGGQSGYNSGGLCMYCIVQVLCSQCLYVGDQPMEFVSGDVMQATGALFAI